jgi:hypothetical protein
MFKGLLSSNWAPRRCLTVSKSVLFFSPTRSLICASHGERYRLITKACNVLVTFDLPSVSSSMVRHKSHVRQTKVGAGPFCAARGNARFEPSEEIVVYILLSSLKGANVPQI